MQYEDFVAGGRKIPLHVSKGKVRHVRTGIACWVPK